MKTPEVQEIKEVNEVKDVKEPAANARRGLWPLLPLPPLPPQLPLLHATCTPHRSAAPRRSRRTRCQTFYACAARFRRTVFPGPCRWLASSPFPGRPETPRSSRAATRTPHKIG